ncbi:MAG: outer membrane protein assembly factor BamA [Oxalobacter sp.]|nr:MAG: outer membrane protein assembly factor BamA [Oxalobacter sp.]
MNSSSASVFSAAFRRRTIATAVLAICYGSALAVTPFTVKDIRLEGLQRTEPGTVFSYLPVRAGDTFNDEKGTAAVKALYATGFFKDIRIEREGNVLVVFVEERPAVTSIEFSGMKEFEKDFVIKALKEIGLAEGRIFDRSLVERAEQELKRQYLSRGLYGVQFTTTVTPMERNRVGVTFAIIEGEAAKIKQINFIGNKAYSDRELSRQMSLTTPGLMTWLTKTDQYARQKLAGDIESLKSYYQNNGYIEMQIESTQVSITPDKKDIYITVNIKEGEQFTVSDVKLEGQMFGQDEEIKKLLLLKKGDVYSGEKMTETTKKIADHMGKFGYAFANVNPHPEIDRNKKEVAFTIFIDPGKRVYVRRINFSGNAKTRDEVMRREFRQIEGGWYDGEKIKLSRDRVDRTGYFSEVAVETPEVPGTNDQVDVNLKVVEKPTGMLTLGAGYSQSEQLMLMASLHQENFAGTGSNAGIMVNTSERYRTLVLTHTNPYFTDDGISRSTDLYFRTTRPPLYNDTDYKIQTMGVSTKFGVPFTEKDKVFFGVGLERNKVQTYDDSPAKYKDFVTDFGGTNPGTVSTDSIPLTVGWQRDTRNSALVPNKGQLTRINFEVSPTADLQYYRTTFQHQHFWPVSSAMTFAFNGQVDYGEGLGGKPYPIFKNFYAGGIGTVRGYEGSSIGGVEDNQALGGNRRVFSNFEMQFPLTVEGKDRTLRWFTFFDAGTVWKENENMSFADLRYSTGVGISWESPIGPLKLSYGYPLNADTQAGDKKQQFQFQIGTGF